MRHGEHGFEWWVWVLPIAAAMAAVLVILTGCSPWFSSPGTIRLSPDEFTLDRCASNVTRVEVELLKHSGLAKCTLFEAQIEFPDGELLESPDIGASKGREQGQLLFADQPWNPRCARLLRNTGRC